MSLSNVVVDLALCKYVVDKAETDEAKYQVQYAAAFAFLTEFVVPVDAVNTERDYGEKYRHSAARGLIVGTYGIAVVGETDEPVDTVNTERDDTEQYRQRDATLFHCHYLSLLDNYCKIIIAECICAVKG